MIQVECFIAKSLIHGKGLFADEDIKKDTLVWKYNEKVDKLYTMDDYEKLSKAEQTDVYYFGWESKKSEYIVYPGDKAKYINHSYTPNCYSVYRDSEIEATTYALRDIEKGEEITINYNDFVDGRVPYA